VNQTIYLATVRRKVNAAHKNKRILFDGRDRQRINALSIEHEGERIFSLLLAGLTDGLSSPGYRFRTEGRLQKRPMAGDDCQTFPVNSERLHLLQVLAAVPP
jgi:hypothetical protein